MAYSLAQTRGFTTPEGWQYLLGESLDQHRDLWEDKTNFNDVKRLIAILSDQEILIEIYAKFFPCPEGPPTHAPP